MRVFQISLLALGLVALFSGEAFAIGCMPGSVEPNSAELFIPSIRARLLQGGWVYLFYITLIVIAYYIIRRFKPAIKQRVNWFIIAAGLFGMHGIQHRFFGSSGCSGIAELQTPLVLVTAWCIASLVFYTGYRLIILAHERYRPFLAVGTPIVIGVGLPALHFLYFTLTR